MRVISRTILVVVGIIVFFEILLLTIFSREDILAVPGGKFAQQKHGSKSKLDQSPHRSVISSVESVSPLDESSNKETNHAIHVAVVVCGERREEATTMLKSITLFTKKKLIFHILAENSLHGEIRLQLDQWPCVKDGQVVYKIYTLTFPTGPSNTEWKKLFKPCASQRLFLPSVLSDIDSLIYLDTDTLVLRPIQDVWQHFSNFNSSQLAGLAPEGEVAALNWYKRFAQHPYYGQLGVNSGVMLMNLTRMRTFGFEEKIAAAYKKYKLSITWGDQDLINIIFHFHPERLYVFGCEWNYRPDHCMYGNNCNSAKDEGISILHGNRGVFHTKKGRPEFKAVYDTIKDFYHEDDADAAMENLKTTLETYSSTYCGPMKDAFLKHPIEYIRSRSYHKLIKTKIISRNYQL